jgi:alkylation response protein AidB-like acyl-CoA dehydrogenase
VIAASTLARGGNDKQQSAYLPKLASGDLIATLAIDETSKHRPDKITLKATRSGNGYTLSGAKTVVLDGHVADLIIVVARTSGAAGDTKGLTLFLVDAKSKGVKAERTPMVDTHNAARMTFDNVSVGADAILGQVDAGWKILEGTLNVGRSALASEMVGASQEAFDRTVTYLRERKQFGKLIGEFQALQHRAADLYCELEVTRSAVLKALQTLDESFDRATQIVSIAKARAGSSSTLAVQEGVQMHGGIGMTDEFDIGLFMKRVRVCNELFGDANFHADLIARMHRY